MFLIIPNRLTRDSSIHGNSALLRRIDAASAYVLLLWYQLLDLRVRGVFDGADEKILGDPLVFVLHELERLFSMDNHSWLQ
jgi:hypothetical protein